MSIYGVARASEYDEKSVFDKGDRERHREYLGDLLGTLELAVARFLELGCGTGFYTELISSTFPAAHGVAIDGSDSMLAVARGKLQGHHARLELECARLETLDFTRWSGQIDLVFSGVALSSLEDADKQEVCYAASMQRCVPVVFSFYSISFARNRCATHASTSTWPAVTCSGASDDTWSCP